MAEKAAKESPRERREEWKGHSPLRLWRKAQGLSLRDTAVRAGTSLSSIQNWEAGVRPTAIWMGNLAQMMGKTQIQLEMDWNRWLSQRPE